MCSWWTWGSRDREKNREADLALVIDDLADRICRGEKIDWPAYLKQHQEHADELRHLAGAMDVLVNFGEVDPNSR